ncbi:MAG: hypothetical protein MJK04_31435, partial [Psychrosphaera sp.]|nr:hypothetical protein [Psychrosphaera sp.]
GYPYKLINDATNRVYQHITQMNVSGQIKSVSYANGTSERVGYSDQSGRVTSNTLTGILTLHNLSYEYEANGNLAARTHGFGPISQNPEYREEYDYDSLNRLTDRVVARTTDAAAGFSMNEQYRYDGFGNITYKQNSGYYQYNANKRLTGVYNNAGFTGSKLYDFGYDGNGSILDDGNRLFGYASFDKPVTINQGTSTTSFVYGMAHKRFYRHDQKMEEGKQVNTHTAYLAGLEKIYRSEESADKDLIEHKFYVGNVVITERTNASDNDSAAEAYLHKDHLGSPLTITDKIGHVIAKNVYDPWGKVHSLFIGNSALQSPIAPTNRGFTGHEGIAGLGIIHMNGRIYDADLGRFLQADPFIQAPKNGQNYNRYSYVLNNPLSYTDPSGHFFSGLKRFVKKYWRVIAAAVVTYFTAGAAAGWAASWGFTGAISNAIVAGAISGAAGGFVATGSLKGALRGALSGAVFGAIGGQIHGVENTAAAWSTGEQMLAHAAAGGVLSHLQGGKFGHGFITAGIMKGVGKIQTGTSFARVMIQSIAGGTVSKLTGGKFANGAVTSALQYVANEVSDAMRFRSTADKPALVVTDVKGELSLEGKNHKIIGLSYDGTDAKFEGPSTGAGGFGVSNSGSKVSVGGPLSLSVDNNGDVAVELKHCSTPAGGLCGSIAVKGHSPKLNAVVHNINVATTPQMNTFTGRVSLYLEKLFGKPDIRVR